MVRRYLSIVLVLGLAWYAFLRWGRLGLVVVVGLFVVVVARRWITKHLTAVATCLLVLVALLQWRTLDNTDQTLKFGQRPWIGINIRDGIEVRQWRPKGNKVIFELIFHVKNDGNSPAPVLVSARAMVWVGEWRNSQKEQCDRVRGEIEKGVNELWKAGYTVFPRDVFGYLVMPELDQSEIKGKEYTPVIVGCIIYRSLADQTLHQTPFFGLISAEDLNAPASQRRSKIFEIKTSDHDHPEAHPLFVSDISISGESD
jgi:hypothetical protein